MPGTFQPHPQSILQRSAQGHEERFPLTRLSAGYGFRKETIAGVRRNGRDAPKADLAGGNLKQSASLRLGPQIVAYVKFSKIGLPDAPSPGNAKDQIR